MTRRLAKGGYMKLSFDTGREKKKSSKPVKYKNCIIQFGLFSVNYPLLITAQHNYPSKTYRHYHQRLFSKILTSHRYYAAKLFFKICVSGQCRDKHAILVCRFTCVLLCCQFFKNVLNQLNYFYKTILKYICCTKLKYSH